MHLASRPECADCARIAAAALPDIMASMQESNPGSAEGRHGSIPLDAATILIVDDDPQNLSLLGELLRPEYLVLAANSGQRALDLIDAGARPDVILLDVMMPGLDGYGVLTRLRQKPPHSTIPVIFITALDAAEDEQHGLALGAVDYLTKPINPGITLARVRTHVELKRARDRLADDNAYLEAEVGRRMAETLVIQDVSIHALARLAEIRDVETGNHLRRTQAYVRTLAELLATSARFAPLLNPATIDLIAKSAPLHDIGKVGIPDYILHKPGTLTPAEWEVMKTHAALGAEAIAQAERDAERALPFLAFAKDIARHHHERWDGTGYPDGLAGDAIPVAARLMALADVFDALISRRVYKDPFTPAHAREIIAAGRGAHFDPEVADVFLGSYAVFCAIAERYADTEAAVAAKHTGRVRAD
jgi:putative two-component system response regulator